MEAACVTIWVLSPSDLRNTISTPHDKSWQKARRLSRGAWATMREAPRTELLSHKLNIIIPGLAHRSHKQQPRRELCKQHPGAQGRR